MRRFAPWLRVRLAIALALVLGLLGAAPAVAAAANYVRLTVTGLTDTSATVTVTDLTYGSVYTATYDAAYGTWDGLIGSPSDSYLVEAVSQSVYENTYNSPIVPTSGSQSTVSGDVYYALTTPITVPAARPTGGSVTFSGVTASGATVTANVYAGSAGNNVANAGLAISATGASPSAGSGQMTVSGAVYGSTDSSGDLMVTLTGGSAGATVTVAVYYNGTQLATGQTTLAAAGGTGGGSGSGGSSASGGSTVGPAGGNLQTPDGAFTMSVPAGAVQSGTSLAVMAASTPPAGGPQPPFSTVASEYFTLTGQPLAKPVAAQIQYRASWLGGLSPDRLSVWQLVGGRWIFVPTAVNVAQGTVSAYVGGPGTLVVLYSSAHLSDMTSASWANPAVDTLLGAGVVDGYPDGSYRPATPVTRGQFIKMLVLSLGLVPSVTPPTFADVSPSEWDAPYIAAAVEAGLVQGVAPDRFDPSGALTRDQMAVLLARALKLQGTATLAFSDAAQVESWAQASLAADVAAGLLSGYPNGTFQPLADSSRAESAQVLAALIHRLAP